MCTVCTCAFHWWNDNHVKSKAQALVTAVTGHRYWNWGSHKKRYARVWYSAFILHLRWVRRYLSYYPSPKLRKSRCIPGVLTDLWKLSFTIPIQKLGSRSGTRNYRGISLSSASPKLWESLLDDQLVYNLKHHINDEQQDPCEVSNENEQRCWKFCTVHYFGEAAH